eukprot:scaffold590685_cov48-Prasinocladus_malaysianus.AAC.1
MKIGRPTLGGLIIQQAVTVPNLEIRCHDSELSQAPAHHYIIHRASLLSCMSKSDSHNPRGFAGCEVKNGMFIEPKDLVS